MNAGTLPAAKGCGHSITIHRVWFVWTTLPFLRLTLPAYSGSPLPPKNGIARTFQLLVRASTFSHQDGRHSMVLAKKKNSRQEPFTNSCTTGLAIGGVSSDVAHLQPRGC